MLYNNEAPQTGVFKSVIQSYVIVVFLNESNLENTLKFFEIKFLPKDNKEVIKGKEEIFWEKHFKNIYKRDSTGRFIIELPMRKNAELVLGGSQENAVKRFIRIWSRLD